MDVSYTKAKKCLFLISGILLLILPLPTLAFEQVSSVLKINVTNEIITNVEWRVHYYEENSVYLPVAQQVLAENLNDVEKGIEQLFLQDVQNLQIVEDNETLVITFKLVGTYSDSFVTGKYRDLYELGEYAPVGVDILKIKIPEGKYLSAANPGPNEIVGSEIVYYNYNWIYPLEINYSDELTTTQIGEEWKLQTIETISVEDVSAETGGEIGILAVPTPISNLTFGINEDSKYLMPGYAMYVGSDPVPGTGKTAYRIADDYKPEIYKDTSGTPAPNYSPDAGYYRILKGYDPYTGFDAYLIQYYLYWAYQDCFAKDHKYDYEPIFIWVENIGDKPYRVAYDRWQWLDIHLHEIHRTDLWSSTTSDGKYDMPAGVYTQHRSYFPSGKLQYTQDSGKDLWLHTLSTSLQDYWNGTHVKLNHANCYNTFDVEFPDPVGPLEPYPLMSLDDAQLRTWYRIIVDDPGPDVMPFKHDIADSFYEVFWEDPDLSIQAISTSLNSVTPNGNILTVDVSATYANPEGTFSLRGLHADRFEAYLDSTLLTLLSHTETPAGRYELNFNISSFYIGDTYTFKLKVTGNLDLTSSIRTTSVNIPGDTQPPNPPDLSFPNNGDTIGSTTPTFEWNEPIDLGGSGIDKYLIQVDNDINFGGSPEIDTMRTPEHYTPPFGVLSNGVTYHWRVGVWDNAGNFGGFTDRWSFTIDIKPDLTLQSSDISFSDSSPSDGDNVLISADISNIGGQSASNVKVRFSHDGTQIGSDYVITSTIGAGGSASAWVTWYGVPQGSHTVEVTVDPSNAIAEANEGNNISQYLNTDKVME